MKAIYMSELALEYFPRSTKRSAVTQLRRWVVRAVAAQAGRTVVS